jgi:hypothetical protein
MTGLVGVDKVLTLRLIEQISNRNVVGTNHTKEELNKYFYRTLMN